MRKINRGIAAAAILTAALSLVGCGGGKTAKPAKDDGKVYELKLGHMTPETEPYHLAALKFKDLIETRSKGKVKITIYPAGQLGYDRELIEGMQFGTIDLAIVTSSPLVNFIPSFAVLDMPFLFRDWDHVDAVLKEDYMQKLFAEGTEKGLVPMALLPRGFRSVTNSKRPITKAADFKGIKLRVIESPVFVQTFEQLGATVTAMSWGEVFTALQQKALDGEENAINTIHNERLYEVQKYVSLTEHMFAFATFTASKKKLDELPADIQSLIRQCAVEATQAEGVETRNAIADYQKKLVEKGMVFNEIDRAALRTKVQKVYDDFAAKYGDTYLKQIEATK